MCYAYMYIQNTYTYIYIEIIYTFTGIKIMKNAIDKIF